MTDTLPIATPLDGPALSTAKGPHLNASTDEAAWQSAKDFEAFFVTRMLETMFAEIKTEAPFGGGSGERAFRSFLHEAYADSIVERGGLGLADHVYAELIRYQTLAAGDQASTPQARPIQPDSPLSLDETA